MDDVYVYERDKFNLFSVCSFTNYEKGTAYIFWESRGSSICGSLDYIICILLGVFFDSKSKEIVCMMYEVTGSTHAYV